MILMTLLQETEAVSVNLTEQLLQRLATGDQEALAELYGQTRAAVYGFSLSIVKNPADAEDVLQDTYLQIYSAAGSYKPKGNPMAWILTITKNLSLMRLRQRSRFQDLEAHEWESAARVEAPSEDRPLLQAALKILSDEERQIILLHALSGLKHREIGSLLDLALPTVLSKYHRGLKKLRNYLKGADAQ